MILSTGQLILTGLMAFAAGAIGSFLFRGRGSVSHLWATIAASLGSLALLAAAIDTLLSYETFAAILPVPSNLMSFSVRLDDLGAIFLAIISLVSLLASIYGYSYLNRHTPSAGKANVGMFLNVFLASMPLVILANDAIAFLISWEIMSLASYFLVVSDHREEGNVRAGFIYFVMTHIATAALLVMFMLLFRETGSFDFDAYRSFGPLISEGTAIAVVLLALVGFGTKAGIIPFHIWLPGAHPAAPSHISALMSGVMIKTGIYMLIRVCFEFFPTLPSWFGLLVLAIGSVSAVLGVLYALAEHDLKRLLAFHSIENIGIILIGLGTALVFHAAGNDGLALLGLGAALFHTINHAIFKSLLFLSAGSVVAATHSRNIESYGGLIRTMPVTATFFLVGSIAISGIIPFNGFASEWLTFQSLFGGMVVLDVTERIAVAIAAASLALTAGLAAACFVKAFGITFLARPRSDAARDAKECGYGMRIPMVVLGLLALVLGVFGGPAALVFIAIAASLPIFATTGLSIDLAGAGNLSVLGGFGTIDAFAIAGALALALLVTAAIFALGGKERRRIAPTWACGALPLSPRMEITATAFSRAIITIFGGVLKPTKQTTLEYHDERMRYFPKYHAVDMHLDDLFMRFIYAPIARGVLACARIVAKTQSGNTHLYLLYVVAMLAILLAWAMH